MLKSSRRHIQKSERHDTPFEGAIAGAESGFPFIALSDMDQVVHVTEVNFCIESCLSQAVKEVGDVGHGVAVLLRDLIQTMEVDAEAE